VDDDHVRQPNHLAGQTSPYLLQHLHNPVDWYPWGPEALDRAREEDKPIFLSIGYAACHWCHVMERESFENDQIAAFLNEHFVCIKVDREERPDLDEIYMTAVQLMTGSGGWPLSVFLTPERKPFFGGTYFPPSDMYGRPGFSNLIEKIRQAWTERRADIEKAGEDLAASVRSVGSGQVDVSSEDRVGSADFARAVADLTRRFDGRWGGFGSAPKFPPHGGIALLLREHHGAGEKIPLDMATFTLRRMALGGMYDQIGGGFARYSVDEAWLVPHFEKMLYDQALLVPVYVDGWLLARAPLFRRVVEETLDFVRSEMTSPEGGFYSSLDADSEGVEGKYYVWTPDEVGAALGQENGDLFCRVYGIDDSGNFEGKSIPNLLHGSLEEQAEGLGTSEDELASRLLPLRKKLLATREKRVRPGTDDKILTAWNGLMITAFARAYQAFGREEDLQSARDAARFVRESLVREGRLLVSYRNGDARLNGYLDDYAFLARGLLDLYESGFDRRDLDGAARLARVMVERFADPGGGGFFFVSDDHEELLHRSRSLHDGALPAGSGVAVETLLRLAVHLDDPDLRSPAMSTLRAYRGAAAQSPSAFASLLAASRYADGSAIEIAVAGEPGEPGTEALLSAVRDRYIPERIVALAAPGVEDGELPLPAGKTLVDGRPAAYLCRDYACEAPVTDPEELRRALDR
jgi:uncharacterized protein YyaL (SSP411 family)